MSSNPPPTKRKRTEADISDSDLTSLPEETIECSAQFWFDDGNVVLQAEFTQFRVHRSILLHHSPVMEDCFQFPQPEGAPTIEGCPLVHLPESAMDISNMCGLLYGTYHVDVKNVTSSYLETMLLLGRKYGITSFTTSAKNFLQQLFPPSLTKWDTAQEDVKKIAGRNTGFLFDVFNLAYEYPIPSIMPPLLMAMCTIYSLAQITSGIPRRPKPRAILTHNAKQYCMYGRAVFLKLSLEAFMEAYCEVRDDEFEYTIPTSTCDSHSACLERLRDIMTEIVMRHITSDAVEFPQAATRMRPYSDGLLCFPCFAHIQELIGESRYEVWEKLPAALKMFEAAVA
ncbi:hypothetical protein HYPSUDRAFT_213202 [Hypholoma sublateritium FD-334 SS-4]|uniref:BTB domain-containing protein n=1 Tax=Hypholoma sublateritium (strain FD-334 SS-4) TaxID=945553 RepID=A0A0D2P6U5_HYPSF|nr:hypothetical protein HYPSUDRAFT_213202 [Hypholoma sublateritium FD-334 SS-4]